jgi:hypothetical protein
MAWTILMSATAYFPAWTIIMSAMVYIPAWTILVIATIPVMVAVVLVMTVYIAVVHRCTSRTMTDSVIMVVAVVSTVPSVTHSEMVGVVMVDVVVTAAVIPTVSCHVPGMSTTIGGVEYRTTIVEVVTMGIPGIDAEVPETVCPVKWTIEIGGGAEST